MLVIEVLSSQRIRNLTPKATWVEWDTQCSMKNGRNDAYSFSFASFSSEFFTLFTFHFLSPSTLGFHSFSIAQHGFWCDGLHLASFVEWKLHFTAWVRSHGSESLKLFEVNNFASSAKLQQSKLAEEKFSQSLSESIYSFPWNVQWIYTVKIQAYTLNMAAICQEFHICESCGVCAMSIKMKIFYSQQHVTLSASFSVSSLRHSLIWKISEKNEFQPILLLFSPSTVSLAYKLDNLSTQLLLMTQFSSFFRCVKKVTLDIVELKAFKRATAGNSKEFVEFSPASSSHRGEERWQ